MAKLVFGGIYGIGLYRKTIKTDKKAETFIIHYDKHRDQS